MRQFAGFGTAEETNERFRYLLDHGQTGLSHGVRHALADGPRLRLAALAGRGRPRGRRGRHARRHGDAVRRHRPRRGQRLDDHQRAGGDHARLLRRRRRARAACRASELGGTIQADILKEYIAQKEWCFPVDPAMRLLGDMIEWSHARACRAGTRSRSPATTSARRARPPRRSSPSRSRTASPTSSRRSTRGLDVDDFAPRLSFFFNAQIDFFEEIAKYRAARRIWARELRETFGAKNPRSWLMRFHTQTAGVSLTAQQPLNNIVRTAIEALAGVLGGTQSLHTNSYDEALALPTEDGGADRAAHAADHRPRDRRDQHHRPARRLLLRRGADRPDGGARPTTYFAQDRRARRHGRGGQARLPAARDRRRRLRAAAGDRRRRADRRRRQRTSREGDDGEHRAPAHRPGARAQADRPRAGRARAPRRRRGRARRSPRCARPRPATSAT